MDMKEKLVDLLCDVMEDGCIGYCNYPPCYQVETAANHLIANGIGFVTDNNVGSKWISVKDRLPEDDLPKGSNVKQIKVLTALKSDKGVRTVRSQMRYRMTWYNSSPWAWKYSGSEITHWQYLPQPPKGE